MATPSLTEQMRAYEDKWVAMLQEPEELIVGSGPEPLDAQLDAQRHGYEETILFWVPAAGTILARPPNEILTRRIPSNLV